MEQWFCGKRSVFRLRKSFYLGTFPTDAHAFSSTTLLFEIGVCA